MPVFSILFPVFALSWAVFFAGAVDARENPSDLWTFNLYFENDLFSQSDQNYTNGIRLSWVTSDLSDYIDDPALPKWLRSINKRLTFFHPEPQGLQRNAVVSIGQTIYTPEDVEATEIVPDDRPYAGWLYTSFAYHSKDENQLDSLDVQLGVVGPSALGEDAQDWVHKVRGFEEFQGWDNQLRDEFGVIVAYEHKRKLAQRQSDNSHFGYDLIAHAGGALGNVATYANAGAEVRLGWRIPMDFGTSAVRPAGDNSAPDAHWDPRYLKDGKWGLHFFASFDTRIVLRDIFIDGNTFESSHSVRKEHIVADLSVGVSAVFEGVKVSYAQVFRTKEFQQQDDTHSYGSFSISYSY